MDIFSQNRFLKRIVWTLVIINISLIGSFWWLYFMNPPLHSQKDKASFQEVSIILEKELGFSKNQLDALNAIRSDFFAKEKVISQQIRLYRDSMNMLMFTAANNDTKLKDLAVKVSEGEFQMELLRIDQSSHIREICTTEQLKKFEGLVREIRDYLRPADNELDDKYNKK